MPFVSDDTVRWANGVLSTGNASARKAMLTTNPVLPPSGMITQTMVGKAGQDRDKVFTQDYSKLKIDAVRDSIVFVKLRPNEKNEIGAMTFAIRRPDELPTVASRNGWTPIWWLPWFSKHIIKMKIRSKLTDATINLGGGIAPIPNPDIFFTAAINGCSVFAVGDSKAPSMYHGGSDGAMEKRLPTELTEDAWRRLLGRTGSTKNIKGIGKTDYISELNPTRANDKDRTDYSTQAARDFENDLKARGSLTNITVRPWGMVFGLRDISNDWTMTLVKNAFVMYQRIHIVQKKRLIGKPKVEQQTRGEMRSTRFYDASGALTREDAATAEQSIQYCYSLGWQDFFPALNAVQMNNLSTITIY